MLATLMKSLKLRNSLLEMDEEMNGNRSKMEPGEKNNPTVYTDYTLLLE